jgi:hypothetical protein
MPVVSAQTIGVVAIAAPSAKLTLTGAIATVGSTQSRTIQPTLATASFTTPAPVVLAVKNTSILCTLASALFGYETPATETTSNAHLAVPVCLVVFNCPTPIVATVISISTFQIASVAILAIGTVPVVVHVGFPIPPSPLRTITLSRQGNRTVMPHGNETNTIALSERKRTITSSPCGNTIVVPPLTRTLNNNPKRDNNR